MIAHAVAQCVEWRSRGLPMNVSINLSARDLGDHDLPDRLEALLARERCCGAVDLVRDHGERDPRRSGPRDTQSRASAALGCKLAIDDYGTGYSSLAYLRRLPVHELKIDKSFVLGLADDANNEIIVRSTIDLAHNMGLAVVAEGVEDAATLDRLRTLRCDMVQGFFISRPLAAADVERWMRESPWGHAPPDRKALRRVALT